MRPSILFVLSALVALTACGTDDSLFGSGAGGGGTAGSGGSGADGGGGGDRPPATAERVDVLLTIDNSRSMADKQELLGLAVPALVRSLVNPACLESDGQASASQPSGPGEACPDGSSRQFPPITDIHFAVITTSLGGHGADACAATNEPTEDDRAHLLTRGPGDSMVNTYEDLGFLAWDPNLALDPPGQSNSQALESNLKGLVLGAGQLGCGYEATHEAWYRFLVEPDPHESIRISGVQAVLEGTDSVLLTQRADFLRPDSLLAIIVLSDENDCSIIDGGQSYFAAQIFSPGTNNPYHLPKPRAACAADPNDPCCRSCGQDPGPGCSTANDDCSGALSTLDDSVNLRCFDQKRRFGIDFLQPIERYVTGLSEPEVADRHGQIVRNPVFSDLNTSDAISKVRDERLVFLTAMVGVPWQDIARRDSNGRPDLVSGRDSNNVPVGGFQRAAELTDNGTWALILGDPANYSAPTDPFMIESSAPRSGSNPLTGDDIQPPTAGTGANGINGHEYEIPQNDDLQYTCIFDLITPRDCSQPGAGSCDCVNTTNNNPLCQNQFNQYGTTQFRAKAHPGIRHLQLLRELDDRGVVGSICPAQLNNDAQLDFGYLPTLRSLVEAVAPVLR
jgi:hypothetical protein